MRCIKSCPLGENVYCFQLLPSHNLILLADNLVTASCVEFADGQHKVLQITMKNEHLIFKNFGMLTEYSIFKYS